MIAALLKRARHLQGQIETATSQVALLDQDDGQVAQLALLLGEQAAGAAAIATWLHSRQGAKPTPEAGRGLRRLERTLIEIGRQLETQCADLAKLLRVTGRLPPLVVLGPPRG